MSNNKNKYIVLPGGKECKMKNPAFDNIGKFPPLDKDNEAWAKFEANNPTYPLTEVMPEGEVFEGSPIKQRTTKLGGNDWHEVDKLTLKYLPSCLTRIAIKPKATN